MSTIKLLHNPKAGDEAHTAEKLIDLVNKQGYDCLYHSTKEDGWQSIEEGVDLVLMAGGDGTVRKVVTAMLNRKLLDRRCPLALLPMGTANNVAKTLEIIKDDVTRTDWTNFNQKRIDVGAVYGLEERNFFLEGFGFGIFPNLMSRMKKKDKALSDEPEKKTQAALLELLHIIDEYRERDCELVVDGVHHTGKYLLAEVMNIRSVGPNLFLNPTADPGDGMFEVALITDAQRPRLHTYIQSKMNGADGDFDLNVIRGKNIQIQWDGKHAHIDDELLKLKKNLPIEIQMRGGVLDFMVP